MIASIAVRLFAIALIATTLDGVVTPLVDALRGVPAFGGSTTWWLYAFIPPLVGVVVLLRARRVAGMLHRRSRGRAAEVLAVGVTLIGIWMLTFGATEIVRATRSLLAWGHLPLTLAPGVTLGDAGDLAGALAQIAAGALLILRRDAIAGRLTPDMYQAGPMDPPDALPQGS